MNVPKPGSPLYRNKPPGKQKTPTNTPDPSFIDLSNVPFATSIDEAKNRFDARAAAAIFSASAADLSQVTGENYGVALLAKWAYQDYFNVPDGDTRRNNTLDSILKQVPGTAGSGGDYDFLLNFYIPLIYKYYPQIRGDVMDHFTKNLLNVNGMLGLHESEFVALPGTGVIPGVTSTFVPETENHLFLIETARYLTNQILYQLSHSPIFDNRRNGKDKNPPATAVWLLGALQGILMHDFLEYNARPYQDNIMLALLNLESYAYDDDIRLGARMALDYISAKVAVSSNDLRRATPFRRRNEEKHFGPFISGSSFLRSPLIEPNDGFEPDVQGSWYSMLAGNTRLINLLLVNKINGAGPGGFGLAMVTAGVHDYRIPDSVLDLFVHNENRIFYQRFHHIHTIPDTGDIDIVNELYAGSPSYLITAGGHPTEYCYLPFIVGFVPPLGAPDTVGSAMPTTFMPTGSGLTLELMIQFGRYNNKVVNIDEPVKWHMGVAPDFACGTNVFPTSELNNADPNDRQGPWTFLDKGHKGEQIPGYYLALYDGLIFGDFFGLLEAYDTWLHPELTFDVFKANILAKHGSTRFTGSGENTYITQSGQTIVFTISPKSEIISSSWAPPFTDQFALGDIINSVQGSGVVTIQNPSLPDKDITLDMHDMFHPVRTTESGKVVERAGFDVHQEVWVDFNSPADVLSGPDGDFYQPFKTLSEAFTTVADGGMIKIMPGTTFGNLPNRNNKRIRIVAPIGGVTIKNVINAIVV